GLLLVRVELLQQPGVVVGVVVGIVIGVRRGGTVGLVEAAEVHRPPAPLLKAHDFRIRIGGANGRGIGHDLVVYFLIVGGAGMHVAMGRVPERRLVIEDVVFDSAGTCGGTEGIHEVLHPRLLNGGAVGDSGIEGIVAGDVLSGGGADAVAGIGVPRV